MGPLILAAYVFYLTTDGFGPVVTGGLTQKQCESLLARTVIFRCLDTCQVFPNQVLSAECIDENGRSVESSNKER